MFQAYFNGFNSNYNIIVICFKLLIVYLCWKCAEAHILHAIYDAYGACRDINQWVSDLIALSRLRFIAYVF